MMEWDSNLAFGLMTGCGMSEGLARLNWVLVDPKLLGLEAGPGPPEPGGRPVVIDIEVW